MQKSKNLIILLLLFIVCGLIACGGKDTPDISNRDEIYLSAGEGSFKYEITKGEMYDELKSNVGLSALVIKVNKDILQKEGYFDEDKVSEEDILKEIEEATFPDGKDGLTLEEIKEAEEEFSDTMFSSYGLKSEEEIKDYYRLVLAKEAYALDKLEEEIAEKDSKAEENSDMYYPDSKYTTYYNSNYQQEFWAIVVPYTTESQAKNALAQLGILVHEKDSSVSDDYACWKWIAKDSEGNYLIDSETNKYVEGETLTAKEVVKAMIDLYNTVYAYKASGKLVLNEGKQYTIDEFGNFVFNTTLSEEDEELNTLHYTYKELSTYNSNILSDIKNKLSEYNANSEVSASSKWYTPTPQSYNSGALYCYCLKIAEVSPKDLDDVKDEILVALKEATLTSTYIETKMAELRAKYNFTIYDTDMEKNYISSMTSYKVEHKATKKEMKDVIASIDGTEYKVEDFYNLMEEQYAVSLIMSMLNDKRFLVNTNYNKYYDYENGKWNDTDKYNELKKLVATEKSTFTSGTYSSYGYSPDDMTWLEFIQEIYGAKDEDDFLVVLLIEDIIVSYQEALADVSEADEASELWKFYEKHMESIKNDYFSVSGIHLLICIYDDPSNTTLIDPSEWTDEQVALAKELHSKVLEFLSKGKGTYEEKLKDFVNFYNKSLKYLPTLEQNEESQPEVSGAYYTYEGIDIAKYRSAGLSVKFENLGAFENGKMVESFDKAVKKVWDNWTNGGKKNVVSEECIETTYGFHIYVNLDCKSLTEWISEDEESTGVLPTFEIVKKYLIDNDDETLSDSQIEAIETYFEPIYDELSGTYNSYIEEYKTIQGLDIDLKNASFSLDTLNRVINLSISNWKEKITYNK